MPRIIRELLDELANMKFETTSSSGGIDEVDLDAKLDDWIADMRSAMAEYAWISKRKKTQSKKID